MSSAAYLARRATSSLVVLVAVSVWCFGLLELAPGDPARSVLEARSGGRPVSETAIQAQRISMGLDEPLAVRYLSWAASAVRGDLGASYLTGRPVADELGGAVGWTLTLAGVATLFSVLGALAVGLLAAVTRSAGLRRSIETVMFTLGGMPGFITALLLLYVFSAQLQVLPSGGLGRPGESMNLITVAAHVALPAAALAFGHHFGIYVRLVQGGVAQTVTAPHTESARARGVRTWTLTRRHLLRPGLVPFVTRLGVGTGGLFAGAYAIEVVFSWPGLGRMAIEAARAEDYPVLTAAVLLTAGCVLLANLVGELVAIRLDPRVRLSGAGTGVAHEH
ncbi:MAG: ABC transporter permease [Ornithinimicrobium sp.]|uniref:ABC transporter permease n=1 Tax=Ornithinimicrobium sp. TaxID=1977084 RepID=UPI003D9AF636